MDKMEMMKEKFIMFAEKLGVSPENIEKIKEDLNKTSNKKEETKDEMKDEIKDEIKEEVKEEITPEVEKEKEVVKVDIAKPIENRMPSEEDLVKMNRDELLVFTKRLMKGERKEEQKEGSPFMIMMKKQGY